MIENFVPDIYQKSIYYINYDKLFKKGTKFSIILIPPYIKLYNLFDLNKSIFHIKRRLFKSSLI